eukprot:366513-Pyramimonas_sp.AAC.3
MAAARTKDHRAGSGTETDRRTDTPQRDHDFTDWPEPTDRIRPRRRRTTQSNQPNRRHPHEPGRRLSPLSSQTGRGGSDAETVSERNPSGTLADVLVLYAADDGGARPIRTYSTSIL